MGTHTLRRAGRISRPTGRRGRAPGVIDLAHLKHYTMENEALERELIGLFLAQLPGLLAQLRRAASTRDWQFATHTLKGSAKAIGAPTISQLAAALEALQAGAPDSRADELLDRLDRAVRDFKIRVCELYA